MPPVRPMSRRRLPATRRRRQPARREGPDLDLLSALVAEVPVPIVAEGRFDTPDLVAEAFRRGAHAVVVGTAITNPREITKKFVQAIS